MSVHTLAVKSGLSQLKGETYHADGELVSAGSEDFIIPDGVNEIGVQVEPSGAASASVYTTLNSEAKVIAGTAIWALWDLGAVTTVSQDICCNVVAIRITQTGTGSVKYSLKA